MTHGHPPLDPDVPETDATEVAEHVVADGRPPGMEMPKSLDELVGGRSGLIDSTLPLVTFIGVNRWRGLSDAVWAAVAVAAVLFGIRVVRKERVRHAVSGFVGILIAALFARATGSASGFFVPGIVVNAVYGGIFLISVLAGRPVLWLLFKSFGQHSKAWFEDRRVKRAHAEATIMWAAVFFARVGVQTFLVRKQLPGWLAVTKLAMGVPLYLAALAATVPLINRRTAGVPDPEKGEADAPVEAS